MTFDEGASLTGLNLQMKPWDNLFKDFSALYPGLGWEVGGIKYPSISNVP